MKTTVELSEAVLAELKECARKRHTTMRELMESALRRFLEAEKAKQGSYQFENRSFKGNGVCEGVEEGNWESLSRAIYEGRGG